MPEITPPFYWLLLTVTLIAMILVLANNPHWFSYLRRRWLRWPTEVDVTGWQADYFAEFTDLLTRLNLPLGYSDEEHVPQTGKLVEPLYWELKEVGHGESLNFLTAHTALSRQDNQLTRNIVRTLLKSTAPLVLLGDPGSGKSVTLRQIGLKLAQWMQHSHAPLIPLYLPLNTFATALDKPGAVRQFVADTLFEQLEKDNLAQQVWENLDELLQAGQIIFLFDSMDEMPRQDYGPRFDALKQFADQYSRRNKFIFACRKLDYRERFESRKVIIDVFSRGKIKQFLNNLELPNWKVLYGQLINRQLGYRELAENPFFLKLIAIYWREKQQLPENQTVLFQEFSRFLLRHSQVMENEVIEAGLAHAAFAMTAHFKGIVVDQTALISVLTAVNGLPSQAMSLNFDSQKWEEVLEVAIKSRLMFRDKQNRLRFQHHRFQEYFTAYYIKRFQPALNWEELYDNIWWQEVLVLLFGISEEPDELMRRLLGSIPKPKAETISSSQDTKGLLNFLSLYLIIEPYLIIGPCLEMLKNVKEVDIKTETQTFLSRLTIILSSLTIIFRRETDLAIELDNTELPPEDPLYESVERLILAARCQGNSLAKLNQELVDSLNERIRVCIGQEDRLVVVKAIEALGYMKDQSILPVIESLLLHESPWVQDEAIKLIVRE